MDEISISSLQADVAELEERMDPEGSGQRCTHVLITYEQAERFLALAREKIGDGTVVA
ncbi:hypothetical protein [Mesorhizobium sp. KR1-2]|uniref:hypothetical protein n=1 Tax=Mesorhizobium sp. KR1-2 TaxID=3156609 RepID=UPI0032B40439